MEPYVSGNNLFFGSMLVMFQCLEHGRNFAKQPCLIEVWFVGMSVIDSREKLWVTERQQVWC